MRTSQAQVCLLVMSGQRGRVKRRAPASCRVALCDRCGIRTLQCIGRFGHFSTMQTSMGRVLFDPIC